MCDTLALLNHLDNITRNQDVLGCSEIIINVIFKHVQHVRIIGAEKLLRAFFSEKLDIFLVHEGARKIAGLWFATWVSAKAEIMSNVTI